MLWNKGGSGLDAHILALTCSEPSTATAVPGAIGFAMVPQATGPTSPTAIVSVNAYAGGGASQMAGVYSAGTVLVTSPVPIFLPLIGVAGAAVTVGNSITTSWCDVGGALIVAPGTVGYVCASATLTAAVMTIGILWTELPV